VPEYEGLVQDVKGTTVPEEKLAVKSLSREIVDLMEDDCLYIIGPGTTTRAVMAQLGLKNTLLGVDAIYDRELIGLDLNEKQLIKLMRDRHVKIIVTIIGTQGYLFGRGNQQISPEVIKRVGKDNIIVIATKEKIFGLGGRPLLVDSGDPLVDMILCGYYPVITGFGERMVLRVGEGNDRRS
jgi:predicted polyphosphate/ATP-dependent NAD kinase